MLTGFSMACNSPRQRGSPKRTSASAALRRTMGSGSSSSRASDSRNSSDLCSTPITHAAVIRTSREGFEVSPTICAFQRPAAASLRSYRSAICESACCACRGFPSPRYFSISASLRHLPNQVQYHVRKGTTTKRTATTASGQGVRLRAAAGASKLPGRSSLSSVFGRGSLMELLRPVQVIEHEVDDDARDGDVEPNRIRPKRDASVARTGARARATERDADERHDGRREDDVRDENDEVDRADKPLTLKTHGAVLRVIDDVGDEEEAGDGERREHQAAVRLNVPMPDFVERRDEQYEARSVEHSV